MKIKVLIVEDNEALNKTMVNMLIREGYDAFGSNDILSAKEIFLREMPHLIILDIMLPNGNGYNLIPFFRKFKDCVIIMLTALSDDESKRISYETGADDYITKPFDLYELIYKLKAIKRRIISGLKIYEIGDLIFNEDLNNLICNGNTIRMQPSQSRLLKLLYEKYRAGTFFDKKDSNEWISSGGDKGIGLQTIIARLRKNLSEVGSERVIIETIYGKGYMLIILKG